MNCVSISYLNFKNWSHEFINQETKINIQMFLIVYIYIYIYKYIYIIHWFVFFETKVDCHELPSNSIFRCPSHFHPHRARSPFVYNEKPLLPVLFLFCFLFMTSSKRRLTVMNFHLILSSAVLLTLLHTGPDLPLNTTRSPYCRHFYFFVSCSWHLLKEGWLSWTSI